MMKSMLGRAASGGFEVGVSFAKLVATANPTNARKHPIDTFVRPRSCLMIPPDLINLLLRHFHLDLFDDLGEFSKRSRINPQPLEVSS
jgi:hypothetical protein